MHVLLLLTELYLLSELIMHVDMFVCLYTICRKYWFKLMKVEESMKQEQITIYAFDVWHWK